MPVSTRFLALIACALISLAGASGIAHSPGAAVHAASGSGIGWDGVSMATGSPAPTTQTTGGRGVKDAG